MLGWRRDFRIWKPSAPPIAWKYREFLLRVAAGGGLNILTHVFMGSIKKLTWSLSSMSVLLIFQKRLIDESLGKRQPQEPGCVYVWARVSAWGCGRGMLHIRPWRTGDFKTQHYRTWLRTRDSALPPDVHRCAWRLSRQLTAVQTWPYSPAMYLFL